MVATQVLPTIQEIWEMINDRFLRTDPPTEAFIQEFEDDINEGINLGASESEFTIGHILTNTGLDEISVNWCDECRFTTQIVNQYTEQEIRNHYDNVDRTVQYGLDFTYEEATPAEKMYCIIWSYVHANHRVIRIR
jgi:hypothetical protein